MQGMVINMEEAKLQTLEQIKAFLDGTSEVAFRVPKEGRNPFIERVLKRFVYAPHGRIDKGVFPSVQPAREQAVSEQTAALDQDKPGGRISIRFLNCLATSSLGKLSGGNVGLSVCPKVGLGFIESGSIFSARAQAWNASTSGIYFHLAQFGLDLLRLGLSTLLRLPLPLRRVSGGGALGPLFSLLIFASFRNALSIRNPRQAGERVRLFTR